MMKRTTAAVGVAFVCAISLMAQAPPAKPAAGKKRAAAGAPAQRFRTDYVQTNQTKNDWEEINFEFNSAILSDGFPTLLWLADFLKGHSDFRLKIVGHTDYVGSNAYNNELAIARAQAVANFLTKYGASSSQISMSGEGKRMPEISNGTKEGRFVNRRVQLSVSDASGRNMSLEDLIRSQMQPAAPPAKTGMDCCDAILKRLDDLAGLIRGLKDNEDAEHNKLRGEIADLRNQISNLPKPITRPEAEQVANTAANNAVTKAEEDIKRNNRKFSIVGLSIGPTWGKDQIPTFSLSGRGRFFSPFGGNGNHAVQAEAEYNYYGKHAWQEGQFDIGLVNRWGNIQAGAFMSGKYIDFAQYQHGGALGQGSFLFDYIFGRGRIGVYGTKGFKNEAILNNQTIAPGAFLQTYARMVDQVGGTGQVGVWGDAWIEGNAGYLKTYGPNKGRPGFTLKLVQPFSSEFAFTAEVGLNESYIAQNNQGRVMFGLQFGNFIRPKDFRNTNNPVPMDIPRIRYSILTRRVGASPPVADAGPDQIGVRPGTITLNGSASYDPLGLTLTYKWQQIGGPSVPLANPSAATTTFTAAEGQTYVFRLTVTNTDNLSASARTTVSAITIPNVNIERFDANPPTINSGQCTILEWNVANAESISITPGGFTGLRAQGTQQVCPTSTTVYTLTGTNTTNNKQSTASATVTVNAGLSAQIVRFVATPMTIMKGETSTLAWATNNANTVTLNGATVPANGSMVVTPTATTTYTLMATGADGKPVSAPVIVQVVTGALPQVISFSLNPATIVAGGTSQLCWQVQGSTSVSIDQGVGSVDPSGCKAVSPTKTTTYTLTATNAAGPVTVSATLFVSTPVQILTFTNDPVFSTASGAPVTLSWTTSGASSVTLTGPFLPGGPYQVNGNVVINPTTNADYTLTAYGSDGQTVSAVLHVFVR